MKNRLTEIFSRLLEHFGPRFWWPADSPFEVCVGAILTQNTNWGNVEKALDNIKGKNMLSAEALRKIPAEQLAELIRPAGYYNLKSARLKEFIGWLFDRYEGNLDRMFAGDWRDLREELLAVRGIGPETCDSILLYAGHKPSFVVDAYTKRLFSRLSLLDQNASYEETRRLFMANLPVDAPLYNEYHALIVQHCKDYCRKKPLCESCPLNLLCGYYRKNRQRLSN
jgi:endonuclease-3 related protein